MFFSPANTYSRWNRFGSHRLGSWARLRAVSSVARKPWVQHLPSRRLPLIALSGESKAQSSLPWTRNFKMELTGVQHHIRNRLVSKLPLDIWPRDDVHSLHCVNFLRQQATCHGDITLQGTDDFLHFSKNNGHKCRDNDALVDWVSGWDWRGHRKWISDKYGLEWEGFRTESVELIFREYEVVQVSGLLFWWSWRIFDMDIS